MLVSEMSYFDCGLYFKYEVVRMCKNFHNTTFFQIVITKSQSFYIYIFSFFGVTKLDR